MTDAADAYGREFASLSARWATITSVPDPVPSWRDELARMRRTVDDLRVRGEWRSGGRTLLRALGIHHDEVVMCRGLAWLLTPDGWHGLGSTVLDGLLAILELPSTGSSRALVVTEETRDATRADIVIRFGDVCVVIEAKICAGEQPRQADRLAEGWADEVPALVFLTRSGAPPLTAVDSGDGWRSIAWSDVATVIASSIAERPDCEPGVREYLRTLEHYGGSRQ